MTDPRCIWCLRTQLDASFDISHVLPEALGNAGQQVLPLGAVCRSCNQYFGTRLEPVFLDHPLIHLVAVLLRVVDPGDGLAFRDQFFDATHPSIGPVNRSLHVDIEAGANRLNIGVKLGIEGRLGRDYDARSLGFFSRAVHKLAFENLAWSALVGGLPDAPDLYAPMFDPVRAWARRGQPYRPVRPLLWMPQERVSTEFGSQIWRFGDDWAVDLDLFDQRYAVSLTSAAAEARQDLVLWAEPHDAKRILISDVIESPASSANPPS